MKQRPYIGIAAFAGMLVLIFDSKTALEGAQQGIALCIRTVIPSLFPFFVLSVLLTGSLTAIPLLTPLGSAFGLTGGTQQLLLPGFLGGYPVGAQAVTQLYRSGRISREAGERLLAFCSNAGPAFLFGMAGSLFSKPWMPWALWLIHMCSAWMVSRTLPARGAVSSQVHTGRKAADVLSLSLGVMARVCGWVVLFRIVIAFLRSWCLWLLPIEGQTVIIGLLELSNGFCELSVIPSEALRFLLCSCMLAFGGLCVLMQTASVTLGLSLRYYLMGKILQTLFSLMLSQMVISGSWYLIPVSLGVFLFLPRKEKKSCSIPGKAVV